MDGSQGQLGAIGATGAAGPQGQTGSKGDAGLKGSCFISYFHILTVPTLNPCTKCMGSHSIIHDHALDCHPVSWVWMLG